MNIYMDGLDHLDEMYKDRKERDRRARELRCDGWTVICKKYHFYDFSGSPRYCLSASRPKNADSGA